MTDPPEAAYAFVCDTDPDVLDSAGLEAYLARISELRAWCDARQVRATRRQRALAAEGRGTDPRSALARHGRASTKDARAATEREVICTAMPAFEDALAAGEVSAGHVDALAAAARHLDDDARAELVACADDLVADARSTGVDAFARGCRDLAGSIRSRHDARSDIDELEAQRERSKITRWVDRDTGMHTTLIVADPVSDRLIWSAVQRERGRLRRRQQRGGDRRVSWDRLTVDALVAAVGGSTDADRPGRSADLVVHVDVATIEGGRHAGTVCETDSGATLPVETVRRLACDAAIIPIVLDGRGVVLDQGRAKRLATAEQRRAIEAMHATCAHPDCTVSIDDCRIHHLDPWQRGGSTDLANLAPLCESHHHLVHEGGWSLAMTAERDGTWTRPDGVTYWSGSLLDRRAA